jgi:hypothetical protein
VNTRTAFSAWTDHLPFAYDLVHAFAPKVIVELGAHTGLSYFTFCQAVVEHAVDARCYAVDTWRGDDHTGPYDDAVFDEVTRFNEAHYASFSELLRMPFAEAAERFEPETIDLLHIDGLHTYEAVQNDFSAWFPKVRPGGVVLLHEVAARLMDFGVWRFWRELTERHACFTFLHGFGLGVLRKAGGAAVEAPLLRFLFSQDEETKRRLRSLYVHASKHVDLLRHRHMVDALKERVRAERKASGRTG